MELADTIEQYKRAYEEWERAWGAIEFMTGEQRVERAKLAIADAMLRLWGIPTGDILNHAWLKSRQVSK